MPNRKYPHVDYSALPAHMRDGAEDYVERGYEPGDFLCAVLSNDLAGAFGHADTINRGFLDAWVTWLYNEAPSRCWGSEKKVAAWIERHVMAASSAEVRHERLTEGAAS